ncbi:MAG: hypothetical protein AAGH64_01590 [Planctomycetota bacterium]
MSELAVLVAQVVASGMMCGLIWFVQIVHYPLFGAVPDDGFVAYAERHRVRTTAVVMPLMFTELGCAAWLAFTGGSALAWAGLGLVGAVWAVTFFVSVPLHVALDRGFEARAHRLLVVTNWARTALWSARLWVSIAMLVGFLRADGAEPVG